MGDSGIPLLRVCVGIDMSRGYTASVDAFRDEVRRVEPALRASGVRVGIQNHYGHSVASALGIMHLLNGLDPDIAAAVLDFAHCALDGEPVDMAVDIVKERLALVNFKNACRVRVNGPDEPEAQWQVLWTTARHGGYSWASAVSALRGIGYDGDLCLPGEYNRIVGTGVPSSEQLMGDEVDERVAGDVVYLRRLLLGE
jgi:sugar phosphate isomerase/epimerase